MEQSDMAQIDHTILQNLPFGTLTLTADGRIASVNRFTCALLGMPASDLCDRTIGQLPDNVQRILATEPALYHDVGYQRWLHREIHRSDEGQRLLLILNVTEQEKLAEENARLRQQVDDLKLTDELTGLPNRRAIAQALDLHVSRSRRYQNPLSVALVSIDLHTLASVRPLSIEPAVLAVSRFLRDRLRWVDQIGRWDDDTFVLVLPETSEQDARGLIDKIHAEQNSMHLPEPFDDLHPELAFGLSCWSKGDDMRTMLRAAERDLKDSGRD